MTQYTIELNSTQDAALSTVVLSQQEWLETVVVGRCNAAMDEIVQTVVAHCLQNGLQIPATKEDMVAFGFSSGLVKTGAQRQAEAEAEMAARLAAEQAAQQG